MFMLQLGRAQPPGTWVDLCWLDSVGALATEETLRRRASSQALAREPLISAGEDGAGAPGGPPEARARRGKRRTGAAQQRRLMPNWWPR